MATKKQKKYDLYLDTYADVMKLVNNFMSYNAHKESVITLKKNIKSRMAILDNQIELLDRGK